MIGSNFERFGRCQVAEETKMFTLQEYLLDVQDLPVQTLPPGVNNRENGSKPTEWPLLLYMRCLGGSPHSTLPKEESWAHRNFRSKNNHSLHLSTGHPCRKYTSPPKNTNRLKLYSIFLDACTPSPVRTKRGIGFPNASSTEPSCDRHRRLTRRTRRSYPEELL